VEDIKLRPLLNRAADIANRRLPGIIRHNRSSSGSARRSFRIAEIRVAEADRGPAALLLHVRAAVAAEATEAVVVAEATVAAAQAIAVVADAINSRS
jgi:hypothetical protein